MQIPTPLVFAKEASSHYGIEVYYKLEMYNPTGTHKDRESRLILEHCKKHGIKEVGCASTGNFAVSLAHFSYIYGIKCHVWLNSSLVLPEIKDSLELFGANIYSGETDLGAIYEASSKSMKEMGIFDANPGACPLKIEANQQIGVEILEQCPGVTTVVCCVNNGSHLLGVGQGLGKSETALYGTYSHSDFVSSIKGFHQVEGAEQIKEAVSASGGQLIEATENDLRQGLSLLWKDGLWAETSSAAVVGILDHKPFQDLEKVCCVITGSGLKRPTDALSLFRRCNKSAGLVEQYRCQ